MGKKLSSVKFSNKVNISEQFGLEKNGSIWVGHLFVSFLSIKEFLEALFAYLKERLSEHRVLHVCLLGRLSSELELKLDGILANHSVENGVLFFELGLSEDVLNDSIKNNLINLISFTLFDLVLFFVVVNSFLSTLFFSLESLEKETSEFSELSDKVVWSNNIENKLDLLSFVLVTLDLCIVSLSLLTKLSLLLVILLLPGTTTVVVIVVVLSVLIGSSLGEVISLTLIVVLVVVVTFSTLIVLTVVLLHLGLTFNGLFDLSVYEG